MIHDSDHSGLRGILSELANPSSEYTVLLPPKEDLLLLRDAIMHMSVDRSAVLGSLLLHVVKSRITLEDLRDMAFEAQVSNRSQRCAPLHVQLNA